MNLLTFHGIFNILMLLFSIFQIYAFFKNKKYIDKFGIFCIIWYYIFYFYIFLEIMYFQGYIFQITDFIFWGGRYDIPLLFPAFYVLIKIFFEFYNYLNQPDIKLRITGGWLSKSRITFFLLFLLLFGTFYSFRIETNRYFSQYEYEPNAYQGLVEITGCLNNRMWDNTSIMASDSYPGVNVFVFIFTGGRYPIIPLSESITNQTFFDTIEIYNVTDVIISDYSNALMNYLYGYVNNTNFKLTCSYIDILMNGEIKNSSLFQVIPWWL
ncbi:MAG: hypothetical protein ACTSVY_16500 [Candidatus Helarchaeota archaeon]